MNSQQENDLKNLVGPNLVEMLVEMLIEMRDAQKDIIRRLDDLTSGFPGGDLEGHRRYHESVIEWRDLRNKIVREALIKVGTSGLVAGSCWLIYAIWQAVKISIKQ